LYEKIYIFQTLCLCILITDSLLRHKLISFYLKLSIPIFKKSMMNNKLFLKSLKRNEIIFFKHAKILFESKDNCIWLQCNVTSNRTTLGLIRKWIIEKGNYKIIKEETRISFGVVIFGLCEFTLFILDYNQNQNILSRFIFDWYSYVFVIFGFFIIYILAFRRVNEISSEILHEILN